ncbi:methyl-accepting chemotaxis protein [Paenibacillus sp. strain BS8-2]
MHKAGNPVTRALNWTIRKKLLLFCMCLLLIPNLILSIDSYSVAKEESDTLIRKNLENSVELMIQNMAIYNEMVVDGQLTLEEAQEDIKDAMLGSKAADGTRPINKAIDLGANGYYYVISATGDLIAHPRLEGQNIWDSKTSDGYYYIQDVIKQGLTGGGFTYYDWPLPNSDKEALKITYAMQLPEWEWIVVAGSYYRDYDEGQSRMLYSMLTTLVICIVAGAIGVWLFSNHISKPIKRIAVVARRVAAGDLSADELVVRNRDEIGELASDFNIMSSNINGLVRQVVHNAEHVSTASHALQSSIDETTQASKQIAESTQNITTGIEMQAVSTHQSSNAMENMARGIGQIAETSSMAHESSLRSKHDAEQGFAVIQGSIQKMETVQGSMQELSAVMETLNDRSAQIGSIVTTIAEIASQTGLLSLNASIEAARAGEHGRGFAVVALEVKKLAELSRVSSTQIQELIQQVQSDIAVAAVSTDTGLLEVREGMDAVSDSGRTFAHIVEASQQIVEQIQEVSAAAEEMSASTEQIYASLQELERVAGRSAASSETISAATEEQIATMEEIAHSSKSLNEMAVELRIAAHRFRIRD